MICPNCGKTYNEVVKFCPECGHKMDMDKHTIQLICKKCGGTLKVDSNQSVLICPFCKSAELIMESDEVAIQRIKSNAYKEIELEKLKHEKEKEQQKQAREKELEIKKKAYEGKHGKFAVFCLVISIICLFRTIDIFNRGYPDTYTGIVTAIQTIILFAAWLTGRKNSYNKTRLIHKILAILGLTIFLLIGVINNVYGKNIKRIITTATRRESTISTNNRTSTIPSITPDSVTNEDEGIYSFSIRNYVGKNAASFGKIYGKQRFDQYGNGNIRLCFIASDDTFVDPADEEQLKKYVVYNQSLSANTKIIFVNDRYSYGEPTSSIDYQNYEEIILYVKPVGSTNEAQPDIVAINPSPDRRTYFVKNYVGRNAASFGREYGKRRYDSYGKGGLRIEFTTENGSYVDTSDISILRQFIVISQDIPANTQIDLTFEKYSYGEETDNVKYQNYETIMLKVRKLDDSVIALMPQITSVPTESPK